MSKITFLIFFCSLLIQMHTRRNNMAATEKFFEKTVRNEFINKLF